MPGVKSIHESDNEDLDQETAESEKTSNDESDSTSGSGLDDDDSSEMDEEDCERRRNECLAQMAELEKQFVHMKEQLYEERNSQVELRLELVKEGTAHEYTQPLEELQQNLKNRLEVAEILKRFKLDNINNISQSEIQAAKQNLESEKSLLWDSIKSDLEEKIRRLEEDRNSIDITSDLWNEQVNHRKNKRKADPHCLGKRKKPVTVT
ncbi:Breast cancer metastasis-suppressor 1-like protein-A, partial [Stegodyphus mimosarum]